MTSFPPHPFAASTTAARHRHAEPRGSQTQGRWSSSRRLGWVIALAACGSPATPDRADPADTCPDDPALGVEVVRVSTAETTLASATAIPLDATVLPAASGTDVGVRVYGKGDPDRTDAGIPPEFESDTVALALVPWCGGGAILDSLSLVETTTSEHVLLAFLSSDDAEATASCSRPGAVKLVTRVADALVDTPVTLSWSVLATDVEAHEEACPVRVDRTTFAGSCTVDTSGWTSLGPPEGLWATIGISDVAQGGTVISDTSTARAYFAALGLPSDDAPHVGPGEVLIAIRTTVEDACTVDVAGADLWQGPSGLHAVIEIANPDGTCNQTCYQSLGRLAIWAVPKADVLTSCVVQHDRCDDPADTGR